MHVIDVGLGTALDPVIVEHAEANDLAIVTADTDFPMLIALRRAASPSIVLLRGTNDVPLPSVVDHRLLRTARPASAPRDVPRVV